MSTNISPFLSQDHSFVERNMSFVSLVVGVLFLGGAITLLVYGTKKIPSNLDATKQNEYYYSNLGLVISGVIVGIFAVIFLLAAFGFYRHYRKTRFISY